MFVITPCMLVLPAPLQPLLYGKNMSASVDEEMVLTCFTCRYGKPAGLFLTSIVFIVYKIALTFEE